MPFCDHLCADEELRLAARKRAEHLLHRVFRTDGVRIHAKCNGLRKEIVQRFLHLLGADTEILDKRLSAGGATGWQGLDRAAEMTPQPVFALVIRHGDIAIVAEDDVSAVSAGDEGGIAPSIDEQHRLLAFFEALAQILREFSAEDAVVACLKLLPHVDDLDHGQRTVLNALGQLE